MFNFLQKYGSTRKWLFFMLESLLMFASVYFSAVLRFKWDAEHVYQYDNLFWKALLIAVVIQLSLYYHDLNYNNIARFRGNLFLKMIQAGAVSFFALSILYYVFPSLEIGRGILLIDIDLLFLIVFSLRLLYLKQSRLKNFGERVLIIGTGRLARQIGQILHLQPERGYKLVGFLDSQESNVGKSIVNPGVIGTYSDLLEIVRKENIETVISALPEQRGRLPVDAMLQCQFLGVKVKEGISFYERFGDKITLNELKPSWVIYSEGFYAPKFTVVLKRGTDVLLSAIGLILASPLMLMIGLLIKLESPGPVIYMQERVGEKGRPFTLYKFRSMRRDAESGTGPVWASRHDERVTRIGGLLRRFRFDELPQLINVLKGDMSLVGPRPERPEFVEQLRKENPYYNMRHAVKPGLTGWAQVKYRYGSSPKEAMEKLQYDLYYTKNASLAFDLYIIFETIKTVIQSKGAR
jgi:sugar transferase (PEP-CTERM system associated)